jgi:hypothetical protein
MNNGKNPAQNQATWLAGYRDQLAKEYPGFNLVQYDTTRLPRGIQQLEAAAKDPQLAKTDAGKGLILYLAARQQAMDAGMQSYKLTTQHSIFTANAALPLREWLRNTANDITQSHPDFGPMYEQLFSHEMKFDPTVGR